ncbi:MAG: hypothetical protein ABIQ91_00025 [Candidatus Paceibacterota bacterium]
MPLFEHRLNKFQNKKQRAEGKNSFFEWLRLQGLEHEGFQLSVSTDAVWKGRRVTMEVVSYGHYQVQNGWMIYISYKGDVVNQVRQHTWRWINGAADISSHKINEFINI